MIKPTPLKQPAVAEFITACVAKSDKTQRQIAEECGFENQNVITMLKTGATKVPVNRVGAIAAALDADPAYLFRLVQTEYMPDTWASIEQICQSTVLTANEVKLVHLHRIATANTDPKPDSLTAGPDNVFTLVVNDPTKLLPPEAKLPSRKGC